MLRDAARELSAGIFETGDRVSHDEHGDGIVTGTYGSKLAVDFDNVGTKRVAVECLSRAPWMPPETLKAILAERDAQRAVAWAAYGFPPPMASRPTPKQRQCAEIIPLPTAPHGPQERTRHGGCGKARQSRAMIVDGSGGRTSNIRDASPNAARTAKGEPFHPSDTGVTVSPIVTARDALGNPAHGVGCGRAYSSERNQHTSG
jgi:hypothetical protein